jgi:hypothetical protein
MKMKMSRILFAMIGIGAVFLGGLSHGEPAKEGSESNKKVNDAGKKAAGPYDAEEGLPPKAFARKSGARPGQPRLKPVAHAPLPAVVKKREGDHAPIVAGPGSGVALPQKPKAALQIAKPGFEIPKANLHPAQTASAAGSGVVNGTSMTALRHGGAAVASIGGITGSTSRGAAALNGTEIKSKP